MKCKNGKKICGYHKQVRECAGCLTYLPVSGEGELPNAPVTPISHRSDPLFPPMLLHPARCLVHQHSLYLP